MRAVTVATLAALLALQAACGGGGSAIVATSLANAVFIGELGASDQRVSDGSGSLTVDVPARSALVYVGQP